MTCSKIDGLMEFEILSCLPNLFLLAGQESTGNQYGQHESCD
jgi:hypothetical protein